MRRVALAILLLPVSYGATVAMDSGRGEVLFTKLGCIGCHNTNLWNRIDRDFTPATLASTMWNHAPDMRAAMRSDLDEQAAADLFAYFYSARFFDKPGDAGRGKRLFSAKHCAECHRVTDRWESMSRPVALASAMWNHAATMRQEFAQRKIAWPELTSQDLSDILVYVRNLPGTLRQPDLMVLSSGENGEALFRSKGCAGCHSNLALGSRLHGQTLTDIAVDMWNHAAVMAGAAPSLDVLEMRDLTSYLWSQQFFTSSGNAAAGQRVFTQKHCAACHKEAPGGAFIGTITGATMVSVLWRHGPQMMDQMKTTGIAWPRFDGAEMSNLIAYLNQTSGKK